jgi:hypothetical protein
MKKPKVVRIKLLCTLPIQSKHGAVEGREFDVIKTEKLVRGPNPSNKKYWFIGDVGEKCAAWGTEVEPIYAKD